MPGNNNRLVLILGALHSGRFLAGCLGSWTGVGWAGVERTGGLDRLLDLGLRLPSAHHRGLASLQGCWLETGGEDHLLEPRKINGPRAIFGLGIGGNGSDFFLGRGIGGNGSDFFLGGREWMGLQSHCRRAPWPDCGNGGRARNGERQTEQQAPSSNDFHLAVPTSGCVAPNQELPVDKAK